MLALTDTKADFVATDLLYYENNSEIFSGDFTSGTVHSVNICVKIQQIINSVY
jgi:hypothetical protein